MQSDDEDGASWMQLQRRLQLALDELSADEVTAADCRAICTLWNDFCSVEGLRVAWMHVLAESDALEGSISAERRLLGLYGLVARFFRVFSDHLTLVDDASTAADDFPAAMRLPDSAAFGALLARALAQCFVADIGAGAADGTRRGGMRRVFELMSTASLRGFLRALLDELRTSAPLDVQLGAACGATLWALLPSARARVAFLCCAERGDDETPAVVAEIGAFIGALSAQSAALFARHALDTCAAAPLTRAAAAALAASVAPAALQPALRQLIVTWSSAAFVAQTSLRSYAGTTRFVCSCCVRLLREAADSAADVEAPLVDGVAAAVEAQPEKLRVALEALRELCDTSVTGPDAAGRLGERLPLLDGLVGALAATLSPDDTAKATADAPRDTAQRQPPQMQQQTQAAPRRDVARVVEELQTAAALGPDAPQKLSVLLPQLEAVAAEAAPDSGFDRLVGDVLRALLTAQNVEALQDWEAQLRRLLRLLTGRFPAAVIASLADALLAAVPSDGGFAAIDVAFCAKLLVAVEEAVAALDADALSAAAVRADNTAQPAPSAPPRGKTRIKAPVRLGLSTTPPAPRTPNAAYAVLTDDVPARVLPAVWRILQSCRPAPPSRAAAGNRSYLIHEIDAEAAPVELPAAPGGDFARALLTAQALHAQAATLLSLSRSRSTLPPVRVATRHWAAQLVILVLDDLARAPSLWAAVPLRRAGLGALLTAVERLSRATDTEDAPDAQMLQRVLEFLDSAEGAEQDELCRRMLLQTMAMIVAPT